MDETSLPPDPEENTDLGRREKGQSWGLKLEVSEVSEIHPCHPAIAVLPPPPALSTLNAPPGHAGRGRFKV